MAQIIRDKTTVDHNYYIRFQPDGSYPGGTLMLGKYKAGNWHESDKTYHARGVHKWGEEVYPGQPNVVTFGRIAAALEVQLKRLCQQVDKDVAALIPPIKSNRLLEVYWTIRTAEKIEDYLRPPGSKEVIVAEIAGPEDIAGKADEADGNMDPDQAMSGDDLSGGFVDTMMQPPRTVKKKK